MRAIAELRELKIRPNQDVADFCVALEKLGRKANPDGSIQDRSLEFAQILLSNLKHWPEHLQFLSALHGVKPERAYEEVKQLALSIEMSRKVYGIPEPRKQERRQDWRERFKYYRGNLSDSDGESREDESRKSSDVEVERNEVSDYQRRRHYQDMREGPSRSRESASEVRKEKCVEKRGTGTRKCFNCSRFGHIGRDCPQRRAQVKQIVEKLPLDASRGSKRMSQILEKARSMGLRTKSTVVEKKPLIGRKVSVWAKLLDARVPALLDTGSMISIVPVGVLIRAKSRGFDVDCLEVIPESEMESVYDASNHKMEFLGAVKITVELENGRKNEIAFHIRDSSDDEILLGTNSLDELGVQLTVSKAEEDNPRGDCQNLSKIPMARRVYVPSDSSGVVSSRHDGKETTGKVVRPMRKGLEARVFNIRNKELRGTRRPCSTETKVPMTVRSREKLGRWGREKWKESGEERKSPSNIPKEQFKKVAQKAKYYGDVNECSTVRVDGYSRVPGSSSDDLVEKRTVRGKRNRKSVRNKVCAVKVPSFSGATLLSPLERGHLLFKCSDGCLEGATLKDVGGCSFPGAVAREPITTLWDAWLATSIFRRTDISVGEKIRMHREGAVCYDADSLKEVLKMAYQKCIDWTDFIANTRNIVKHAPVDGHYFDSSYDEALKMVRTELEEESARWN
ncbi:hypothetical protein Y032_0033g2708 [Ancylostoma ceylanicum]|uniref:CCHC-type domain-containing protein n=1 Tax=Ancylostoma ceylanicum TaxID=53326 RepID=A0A016UNR8_9BILA|nr:hypothetical protein Y032_0033g2708 [Ancylostoma ceylanicum]